jgi:NADH:ubiquinone oxidoreductase subunit 5 (subunit L)/multisubunit Na+/H+ antiporter MnhA subunit
LYAITQHDIKRLLAYHSIENIGIIGMGIGIGMLGLAYGNPMLAALGFAGGILHVLNHSIFKELLFFAAGSVYLKTHTRNIETLGGLIKKMPLTALMFIVGSVAICGLPPFNGFISEFLIYSGMLLGIPASELGLFIVLVAALAALAMVGTMAVLCFTKASGIMFLGEARSEKAAAVTEDVEKVMLIPMAILALACFVIGMLPQYIIKFVLLPVSLFVKGQNIIPTFTSIISLMGTLSVLFGLFLAIVAIILVVRMLINRKYEEHCTWGCGYNRANNHMQYTASSYANPFISTLKPLFKRVSHIKKPKDLFPKEAYYELEIEDIEEAYIVNPIVKWDEKILAKFERIQNGNIQQYILFGLIFLVIAIVGLIFIG